MLTIKPQSLSCLSRPVPGPGGTTTLVVTVMVGFEMNGVQQTLCSDQKLWKALASVLPSKTAPDLGFTKPRAEWLAFGRIYPEGSQDRVAQARVLIRRANKVLFDKKLQATGERRWLSRAGIAWPSEAAVIKTPVPLDWTKTYGGPGHGLNPSGVGRYAGSWVGQAIPQIEYANNLISSPDDTPAPAGFGPVPLDAPARFKPFGTYDAKWRREDYPALPSDSPTDALMVGPRDQQMDGVFLPGDEFTCEGMADGAQARRWVLPSWQPRCFIRRASDGGALVPLEMHADTVLLIPHVGIAGLMWRASIAITESDAHDVKLLFAALESIDAPRPISHYLAQLEVRSGVQQDAAMAMLDESPLLPQGQSGSLLPDIPPAAKARMKAAQDKAQGQRAQAVQDASQNRDPQAAKADADASAASAAQANESVDISEQLVKELSADSPDPKKIAVLVKRARELGVEARKASIEKIAAMTAEHGVDIKAQAAKKLKDLTAGPPTRRALATQQSIEEGFKQGALDRLQADRLQRGLSKTLLAAQERYRKSAHWMPEAGPLAEPQELGRQILELARSGRITQHAAGSDWVGADLSNQQLDGINLSGAFLDGANFAGASLVGANLSQATLSRANFAGANLSGANLSGANLGRAFFGDAILDEAVLTRAVLDQANLNGARLVRANLQYATLIGINIGQADFTQANMNECKILGLDIGEEKDPSALLKQPPTDLAAMIRPINLSGMCATGVSFHKAAILGCEAEGAQFSKADFLNATLAHCDLQGSDFSEANFSSTSVVLNSSLAGSRFNNATLQASFLREVDLSKSDMRGADLGKSYFGLANMTDVNAIGVKAASARFERTNLKDATFASAELTGALFMGAQLSGTSFDDAKLTLSDFSKAQCDAGTSFRDAITGQAKMPRSE